MNLFFAFCANNPAPLDDLCAVSALGRPRPFPRRSFINRSVNQTGPPVCGANSTALAAASKRWKVMLIGMMGRKKYMLRKAGLILWGISKTKQLLCIYIFITNKGENSECEYIYSNWERNALNVKDLC